MFDDSLIRSHEVTQQRHILFDATIHHNVLSSSAVVRFGRYNTHRVSMVVCTYEDKIVSLKSIK